MKNRSLQELLDLCCDSRDAQWELGWSEFISQYKQFIYQVVTKTCLSWNVARLQKQLSETVNDIVSEVFLLLCENRGQVLKGFRARDNEHLFLAWLATVCRRKCSRHILRYFSSKLVDAEAAELPFLISPLGVEQRWELYEHFVRAWRFTAAKNKHFLERDIFIFQLYVWADFSSDMISRLPCLNRIGHRVVDNTVNRMRSSLMRKKTNAYE